MPRKRFAALSVDVAKKMLRGAGLRCTAARIAVVQYLAESATPVTPAEVDENLCEYGFDKSTIYRSLAELSEGSLVVRLDLGDSVRRFELTPPSAEGLSDHPHFMCVDCGKVVCLSDFEFTLTPVDSKKPPPGEISQVLVKGHCNGCGG